MVVHNVPRVFELTEIESVGENYVCPKTCDLYFSLRVINRNLASDLVVCNALMDNPVSN